MSKIEVNFNEREYSRALKLHTDYSSSLKSVQAEALKLGVEVTEKELLEASTAFALVAQKMVDQMEIPLPNINPTKFLMMTEYDLTGMSEASNQFNLSKQYKNKPSKDSFIKYLEGNAAAEYKKMQSYCEVLNEMVDNGLIQTRIAIQQATAGKIIVDRQNLKFTPKY